MTQRRASRPSPRVAQIRPARRARARPGSSGAGLATLALALAVLGGGAEAQDNAQTLPTVTVTAPSPKNAPQLVRRFAAPASGGRLSRWRAPVCPTVLGLAPDHAAAVADRIREIARAAGAGVEAGKCPPDIIVIVSSDASNLRRQLAARGERFLNGGSRWPIDKSELFAFTKDDGAPAHVFHLITQTNAASGAVVAGGDSGAAAADVGGALDGLMGGLPVVSGYQPSRLAPHVDEAFFRVLIVLDGTRLAGFSLAQIAAYVSMTTLAEVRTDAPAPGVSSIITMFADAAAGRTAPPDLTFWDRAYLGALYAAPSAASIDVQQSAIARRIERAVEVLQVPTAAPPPPGGGSEAPPPSKEAGRP